MKKGKKSSKWRGSVATDAKRQKSKSFGYLILPDGVTKFKEKKGRNHVDIIPYIVKSEHHPDNNPDDPNSPSPGNPWYKRPIQVHHGIGVDNESVICPKTDDPKAKCPICEEKDRQYRDGIASDDVEGKTSFRYLYVVIPKGMKDFEEEMHIWDIAYGNFQKELDKEIEEDPDKGDFPDPEDGTTLNIRFSEESFGKSKNKFCKASRIDFDKRRKQYKEKIMKQAPCLDECYKILSYDELKMKFYELSEDDIKKDKKSDKKGKKEKSRKRKSAVESPEKKKEKKSKSKKLECPHGHKFAKHWDEKKECSKCKLNDTCGDANEAL